MRMFTGVKRVLVGIPDGHKHIRTAIEFESGETVILNESEMANISRSFIHVLTHPIDDGIELRYVQTEGKEGFSHHQLLNTPREPKEIRKEISAIMSESK